MRALPLTFGVLLGFASPAAAAPVTLATDTVSFDPMCLCNLPSQPGELRYEIYYADPGDTVEIAPGVNPNLDDGQILIDKDLTIAGQGANATSISASGFVNRIFKIGSVVPASVVTIRDLQMSGGNAPSAAPGSGAVGEGGGAILTNADLTLNRVRLTFNFAGNGGSGAVGMNGMPSGGMGGTGGAGGSGGAILNQSGGDLTVMNSTFDENSAGDGGTGGQGGNGSGMFAIAGNGGTGGLGRDGGAISNAGAMTVINSTLRGNEGGQGGNGGNKGAAGGLGAGGDGGPGGHGGAIHQAGAGSLTLSNVTIADNNAGTGGSPGTGAGDPIPPGSTGAEGTGGGTFLNTGPSSIVVANTLYSLNTGMSGSNCAGPGTITAQGANLAFPAGGCPASFLNGDPQLSFGNNGGPTPTSALGAGSAAINTGGLTGPATDQRGVLRPQGSRCDIGAFELEQATIPGSTCAGPPASPLIPPTTPLATGPAKKRCKKGRKLKKGRCVRKKRRK